MTISYIICNLIKFKAVQDLPCAAFALLKLGVVIFCNIICHQLADNTAEQGIKQWYGIIIINEVPAF